MMIHLYSLDADQFSTDFDREFKAIQSELDPNRIRTERTDTHSRVPTLSCISPGTGLREVWTRFAALGTRRKCGETISWK